jgi:hypothetical protein
MVIQAVKELGNPLRRKINSIIRSIRRLILYFDQIHFLHIKRGLNVEATSMGKLAMEL